MFKLLPFLLFAVSLSAFAVQTDSAEEQMNAIFQTIHDGNEQFLKNANLVHDRESAEALALAFQKTEEKSLRNSLKIEQWSKEQPQEFASVSAKWKKRFEEQKMDMAAVFRSIARQNWYGSKTLENHCQSLADSVNLIDPVPIGEFLGTYYLNPRPERIGWFLNLLPDLLDTQRLPGEQNPFAFFLRCCVQVQSRTITGVDGNHQKDAPLVPGHDDGSDVQLRRHHAGSQETCRRFHRHPPGIPAIAGKSPLF